MSDSELVFSSHQEQQSGRRPFALQPTQRYFWRRWCNVGVCRAKSQQEVAALESSYGGQSSRWSCGFFLKLCMKQELCKECVHLPEVHMHYECETQTLSPNWFLSSDSQISTIRKRVTVWKTWISQRQAIRSPDIVRCRCRQLTLQLSYCPPISRVCDTKQQWWLEHGWTERVVWWRRRQRWGVLWGGG